MTASFEDVRRMALGFPGVVEGTSYGTPAFRVGKAFITRLHEDGESLVMRIGFDEREMLMEADPAVFHITEHYRAWPMALVRFGPCAPGTLRRLFEASWRAKATKRLVAAYEAGNAPPASA